MEHFLNTLALTGISFSGRFVFALQKHCLFFASDPLVVFYFFLLLLYLMVSKVVSLGCMLQASPMLFLYVDHQWSKVVFKFGNLSFGMHPL